MVEIWERLQSKFVSSKQKFEKVMEEERRDILYEKWKIKNRIYKIKDRRTNDKDKR
jgi:hypothetical protein